MTSSISYDEVRDAQYKTKLDLGQGCFLIRDNCACPLTLLYVLETGIRPIDTNFDHKDGQAVIKWAYKRYGQSYTTGFWQGFDDHKSFFVDQGRDEAEVRRGFEDGKKVLHEAQMKQMFGHFEPRLR